MKKRITQLEILLPGDALLRDLAVAVADQIGKEGFLDAHIVAFERVIQLMKAGEITGKQSLGFERLLDEVISERRQQMRRAMGLTP